MNKYDYEYERVNDYCYPGSFVLRNRLDIRDGDVLAAFEREITATRIQQILAFPVKGAFDLQHLRAIHRAIFSDVYEWAGELRVVNIAKGNQFCSCVHLETYAEGIFTKLKTEKRLTGTTPEKMPERMTYYLSEINVLHPFREGNGRAQRVFAEYLARAAGWSISFADVAEREMIEASALAFAMDYGPMTRMFEHILSPITPEEQRDFRVKIGMSRLPKEKQ
ncbi:Fic family protein [Clostridia bacterium]|nr:Fic family protein [Clostridia bacterium]